MDLSKLSDEELDAIISGRSLQPQAETTPGAANAASRQQMLSPSAQQTPEDFSRGMDPAELFLAGIGGNLKGMGLGVARGAAGVAGALPGVDFSSEKAELDAAAREHGATMRDLRRTTPGMLGDVASDVGLAAATPVARGASMVGNAARTAAMTAPLATTQAYGQGQSAGESLITGAMAGAGGAGASALFDTAAKGINAIRGKWEDPSRKYLRDFAREKGVDLRTGDLYPNSVVRRAENIVDYAGGKKLPTQTNELDEVLFGNGNQIAQGIGRARKVVDAENTALWSPVYEAAEAAGTTNVRPVGLYKALADLIDTYPQALNKIENQQTRRLLETVATSGGGKQLPGLTFREMRELQQAIGPELAAMKIQVANGSMTKGQVDAVSNLYASTKADLKRWGNAGQNQKAYSLYEQANDVFKKNFLPFYDNDIVLKLQKGLYEGHNEQMLQDLLRPLGRTQREQLLWYLGKTDHDAAGYVELVKAADRAARNLKSGPQEHVFGPTTAGVLFAPKAIAAAHAAGHGSSKLLPMYGASREIAPEIVERGVKGGLGLSYGDMFGNKGR